LENSKVSLVTLYLGFYNGEKYLESLFHQIQSQYNQNFKILVVDNNSPSVTKKMFKEWEKVYKNKFQFIQNDINYGSHGSLLKNLNNISTPWFCTLHQDDFYKPNHVSTIINLIAKGGKNIVGVSTTMGSMTNSGKIMNSKPRVNWFSPNLDQPGQFLQNLRAQTVPFPATAFRLNVFKQTKVPIHSASFSDTEQTLKMLGYGRFVSSQTETMLYRENPNSESHVLNEKERIIGAAVALTRVFCSNEFDAILEIVDRSKREVFANQLIKALMHRVPKGDLLTVLENIALEQMTLKWGYSQKKISHLLGSNYATQSSWQTVKTINNLSDIRISINQQQKMSGNQSINSRVWDFYFNSKIISSKSLNKLFLKLIYKIVFVIKPNHRMKNRWK
jgi:glycosyltransferase involved in cell wall biosynthesis